MIYVNSNDNIKLNEVKEKNISRIRKKKADIAKRGNGHFL